MNLVTERNLTVKYYEKDERTWIAESHMVEEQHDIIVTTELDMELMTITHSEIKFVRYPQDECKMIEKLAESLVGLKADRSFSQNAMRLTMGPEGCPNIMTLLNISIPGIIYYYYPYKIKNGEMTYQQFLEILRQTEKNACLAHTLMFAEK